MAASKKLVGVSASLSPSMRAALLDAARSHAAFDVVLPVVFPEASSFVARVNADSAAIKSASAQSAEMLIHVLGSLPVDALRVLMSDKRVTVSQAASSELSVRAAAVDVDAADAAVAARLASDVEQKVARALLKYAGDPNKLWKALLRTNAPITPVMVDGVHAAVVQVSAELPKREGYSFAQGTKSWWSSNLGVGFDRATPEARQRLLSLVLAWTVSSLVAHGSVPFPMFKAWTAQASVDDVVTASACFPPELASDAELAAVLDQSFASGELARAAWFSDRLAGLPLSHATALSVLAAAGLSQIVSWAVADVAIVRSVEAADAIAAKVRTELSGGNAIPSWSRLIGSPYTLSWLYNLVAAPLASPPLVHRLVRLVVPKIADAGFAAVTNQATPLVELAVAHALMDANLSPDQLVLALTLLGDRRPLRRAIEAASLM